jgi:hypothetical protein
MKNNDDIRPDGLRQSDVDYIKQQHINFALPMYDGKICDAILVSLIRFAIISKDLGFNFSINIVKHDSMITRTRNKLVSRFMIDKRATHMIFIDSDIEFQSEDVLRLLLHKQDVVGGIYPLKTLPIDYVINLKKDPKHKGDLLEVNHIGTGFLLIKKTVIEKMIENHPELKYNDLLSNEDEKQYTYAFFENSIDEDGIYQTEDYTFCNYWTKLGGSVFADVGIELNHIGSFTYPSNSNHLISIINSKIDQLK